MRKGESGFTLVEVLIVLAIIGVASGAVILGLGSSRQASAFAEAQRIASLVRLASDQALVDDRPFVLALDASGYAVPGVEVERRSFPEGIRVAAGEALLVIGPDGMGRPFDILVTSDAGQARVRYDGLSAVAEEAPR